MYRSCCHDDDRWSKRNVLWLYENDHTIDKMVNEQTEKIENVELPSDSKANVKKGDFVFLVKEKDQINSQEYLK